MFALVIDAELEKKKSLLSWGLELHWKKST